MSVTLPYSNALRHAVARGEAGALERALAALAATWLSADGFCVREAHNASLVQLCAAPHAACALDVVRLLSDFEQGRQALRDLGFQQLFQQIEGE